VCAWTPLPVPGFHAAIGPDCDEPGSRNQANKDGRLNTEISQVFFLK
jgi:hypothetical protein